MKEKSERPIFLPPLLSLIDICEIVLYELQSRVVVSDLDGGVGFLCAIHSLQFAVHPTDMKIALERPALHFFDRLVLELKELLVKDWKEKGVRGGSS